MPKTVRPTLVILVAFLASGCQFLGIHKVARAGADHEQIAVQAATIAPQLQAGREYLDTNRNGLAIEAFNRALASGEEPAEAYNGLGVAYARIGRDDLAFRFFKKARMSDPENPTYARNLSMLMDSPRFTMALAAQPAQPLVPTATPALPEKSRQAGVQLRRDGGRQFTLVTAASGEATAGDALFTEFDHCFSAKHKRACSATALPTVKSRNRAAATPPKVAEAEVRQTATAQSLGDPASTPPGKRRIFDLSQMPGTSKPLEAASPRVIGANTKS